MQSSPPVRWPSWYGGRPAAARRALSAAAAPVVCTAAALATLTMPAVLREPPRMTGASAFAGIGAARGHRSPLTLPEESLRPPLASILTGVRAPPAQGRAPPPPVSRTPPPLSVASRLGSLAITAGSAAVAAVCAGLPRRRNHHGQSRRRLQGLSSGIIAALPATFKAFSESNVGLMLRLSTLNFCKIYMAMLVLRITIMWFPNINPYRQPFYSMIQLTDPYLNLFRGWMPPIFGIDLSVILAFVVIQAVIDTLTVSPF
mmetsp:Transcript_94237/g.293581  ORF Transcript_94237/g.293581 Transcript_94237/m.293581 type:complete len:259 (-) Transcript_94237:284-1060(-)